MKDREQFNRNVGKKIRLKRVERGLSQESLAKGVGLKRPSMSNIEKGRQNLLLHTFCDIADALGTDANLLLPQPVVLPSQPPNLHTLSKDVREFVEAAIKPVQTKNRT